MRQTSGTTRTTIGHQSTRLFERPNVSLKLNSAIKEPPLSTMKRPPPMMKKPPPSITAFDLRGIHPSTSSSSSSIFTPVLRSSMSPSPRAMPTSTEVEMLRKQLEKLEAKFQSVSTRFREQTELHACDKARADQYEKECARLQTKLERKTENMMDKGVQTIDQLTPSPTPPPLLPIVVRRPSPLPLRRPSPDSVSIGTSPMRVQVSSSPARRTPPRWNTSPSPRTEQPVREASRRPSITPIHAPNTTSTTLVRAKNLLDNLKDDEEFLYSHFDRLDGGKSGSLSRDLCLAMVSLIFEEKQIHRSATIPKVICSRMLRSLGSSSNGVSSNRSVGSSSVTCLHRENLIEFIKLVLEFVIEEERATTLVPNSSSSG